MDISLYIEEAEIHPHINGGNGASIFESMKKVEEKDKIYESLSSKYDPQYKPALDAVSIIKKFIADRGLIIYGGTAVDYALRLHGSNIYPDEMLDIPDLDFYSPDSVKDAYDLATILFKAGYTAARAIPALYVITMRVDIADNHFLADISYVPPEIFKTLPVREYEGMKIIDPIFQKIDFHYCLSHPYDNPPREVIFEKWKKYIFRFNLLHQYYPTPEFTKANIASLSPIGVKVPEVGLLTSFAAYAVIRKALESIVNVPSSILPCKIKIVNNVLTVDTIDDTLVLMHFDLDKAITTLNLNQVEEYRPYINIIPKYIKGISEGESSLGDYVNVVVLSSANKYTSVARVEVDGVLLSICGIQYLMLQFLSFAHTAKSKKIASTYYAYYESIMEMIKLAEAHYSTSKDDAMASPFFPTTKVYGSENISPAYEISFKRIQADLGEVKIESIPTPKGYHPSRGAPYEPFDYSTSIYFGKDGGPVVSQLPAGPSSSLADPFGI